MKERGFKDDSKVLGLVCGRMAAPSTQGSCKKEQVLREDQEIRVKLAKLEIPMQVEMSSG